MVALEDYDVHQSVRVLELEGALEIPSQFPIDTLMAFSTSLSGQQTQLFFFFFDTRTSRCVLLRSYSDVTTRDGDRRKIPVVACPGRA